MKLTATPATHLDRIGMILENHSIGYDMRVSTTDTPILAAHEVMTTRDPETNEVSSYVDFEFFTDYTPLREVYIWLGY
jgi:hypothetical protein